MTKYNVLTKCVRIHIGKHKTKLDICIYLEVDVWNEQLHAKNRIEVLQDKLDGQEKMKNYASNFVLGTM